MTLFDEFSRQFFLFCGQLQLLLAFALKFDFDRKYEYPIRCGILLIIGYLNFQYMWALYEPDLIRSHYILFYPNLTIIYILIIAIHYYARTFTEVDFCFTKRHLLHGIVVLLLLSTETATLFFSPEKRAHTIALSMLGSFKNGFHYMIILRATLFFVYLVHLTIDTTKLLRHSSFTTWRSDAVNNFRTAIVLMGGVVVMCTALLMLVHIAFDAVILIKIILFSLNLGFIILCMIALRFPYLMEIASDTTSKVSYERSTIENLDVKSMKVRLDDLMHNESLYSEENLTLKKVADKLRIRPHQLSELLNQELGVNFRNYINHFRIKEAKRLLMETPDETILNIAFSVGFNSQSTFYSAFVKIVGKTPKKYRTDPSG